MQKGPGLMTIVKLQETKSTYSTQLRLGVPKSISNAMGWKRGDLFEVEIMAKNKISYKKVKT